LPRVRLERPFGPVEHINSREGLSAFPGDEKRKFEKEWFAAAPESRRLSAKQAAKPR